jgi:hypothetical protein
MNPMPDLDLGSPEANAVFRDYLAFHAALDRLFDSLRATTLSARETAGHLVGTARAYGVFLRNARALRRTGSAR